MFSRSGSIASYEIYLSSLERVNIVFVMSVPIIVAELLHGAHVYMLIHCKQILGNILS